MNADMVISVLFLIILAVSAAAALHGRLRRGAPLGLGMRGGAGRELAAGLAIGSAGLAIGSAGMAATVAAVVALTPTGVHDVRFDAAKLAYATAVLAAAAVGEEVVYRALMLGGLARLTRRPAVALLGAGAVFGLVHITGSPDATAVSVLSNALGGVNSPGTSRRARWPVSRSVTRRPSAGRCCARSPRARTG
ncbi:CPBP family intramembrane glutamic endopeptidase [Actinomadura latina]|uniref:CPBP family intramembrane metalloprotease n=1 Tax=Actinomadura latina TaxID=163603 RepID=A0A846Z7I3_9ACTN|nr:CPBP family intramembrane glutamic endopeptidase [Actinomadura latina]NKZ09059.1 CPBP family intramembrane metalloprotease [Actinomadura latina]